MERLKNRLLTLLFLITESIITFIIGLIIICGFIALVVIGFLFFNK
jgi:hypothetical protein